LFNNDVAPFWWVNLLGLTARHQPTNKNEIKHSFFVAGPDFTGIMERTVMSLGIRKKGARDVNVLKNVIFLFVWGRFERGGSKLTRKKKVIFTYSRKRRIYELVAGCMCDVYPTAIL